jgi:hypothetical protein
MKPCRARTSRSGPRKLARPARRRTVHDTLTFVGVPLVMVGMAIAACVVPARRAERIDPMAAIRRWRLQANYDSNP